MLRTHKPIDGKTVIFVTHVPKCVGSSLRLAILDALNIESEAVYYPRGGGKRVLFKHPDWFRYYVGHSPWRIHWFLRPFSSVWSANKIFIATFREPLDQLVSFYYYHKQLGENSPYYIDLDSGLNLIEFFKKNQQLCNQQTRLYAGYGLQSLFKMSVFPSEFLVRIALGNIVSCYHYWVHHSYLSDSIRKLSNGLGVPLKLGIHAETVVNNRPEIQDLKVEEIKVLTRLNSIDILLHAKLRDLFKSYYCSK